MLNFDHPLFAGGVSLVASDNGEEAEKIRRNVESRPLWLSLWRNAYAKLPPKGKRVLMALAMDWRSNTAAKKEGKIPLFNFTFDFTFIFDFDFYRTKIFIGLESIIRTFKYPSSANKSSFLVVLGTLTWNKVGE